MSFSRARDELCGILYMFTYIQHLFTLRNYSYVIALPETTYIIVFMSKKLHHMFCIELNHLGKTCFAENGRIIVIQIRIIVIV